MRNDPLTNDPLAFGFSGSISKPFTLAELSEMLNAFYTTRKAG
jgi:hypothetical protein